MSILVQIFALSVGAVIVVAAGCCGVDRSYPGGTDAFETCEPTLESLRKTVFAGTCDQALCHDPESAAGGLDLTESDLATVLIGAEAPGCAGDILVVPGDPERSFLVRKLEQPAPKCGETMPPGDSLRPAEIACVRDWIASLGSSSDGGLVSCERCGTARLGRVQLRSVRRQMCGGADLHERLLRVPRRSAGHAFRRHPAHLRSRVRDERVPFGEEPVRRSGLDGRRGLGSPRGRRDVPV